MKKETRNISLDHWSRLLVFAVLYFLINSWCIHHLGKNVLKLSLINAIAVILSFISYLERIHRGEENQVKEIRRKGLLLLLETRVLIVLICLFFIWGSMYTSVTVMASGLKENKTVTLVREGRELGSGDQRNLNDPDAIERFGKFVSPFGSSFYLEVDGYIRYSFEVFPWLGKKIRVAEDLIPSPSLIIRVPVVFGAQDLQHGRIALYSGDDEIAGRDTNVDKWALLVGRELAIPDSFRQRWRLELFAIKDMTETIASRTLLRWQNPLTFKKPSESLKPEKSLIAKFLAGDGSILARVKFIVSSEKLQDILLYKEERP